VDTQAIIDVDPKASGMARPGLVAFSILLSRDPVDARRRVVQALPWRLHFREPAVDSTARGPFVLILR